MDENEKDLTPASLDQENEEASEQSAVPAVPEVTLPAAWQSSGKGLANRKRAQANVSLKHGLFAGVPIICRGEQCPYFQTCFIPEDDLQIGERCPIEIATILERFDRHCLSLNIDADSINDTVDAGIVKDVVDIEIMILRCDNLLAINGNLIDEVVAGVTPKGQEIMRPEINKAVELKQELRRERTRLLNQLNATRKDKGGGIDNNDPSTVAARIIAKVQKLQDKGKIIDVSPEAEPETE